jgi:hypothetical protein
MQTGEIQADPAGPAPCTQQTVETFEGDAVCPARGNRPLPEPDKTVSTRYLRAAQAYMLISMPTGTSTIFGVFQLMKLLPSSVLARCSCQHRN